MSEKNDTGQVTIDVMKNGPIIVKGLQQFQNSRGEAVPMAKSVIALCRCGASENKPFCDGTHSRINFSGDRETDRPIDKVRDYVGEQITIHDNRTICAHAATCVKNLPQVFRKNGRPWIAPDEGDVEAIIDAVKQCPSGALSYTIGGKHHEEKDLPETISITKDGPYHITGDISIGDENGLQPPNKELYTLCRCGASKNKPFCDGSHYDAGFEDSEN